MITEWVIKTGIFVTKIENLCIKNLTSTNLIVLNIKLLKAFKIGKHYLIKLKLDY